MVINTCEIPTPTRAGNWLKAEIEKEVVRTGSDYGVIIKAFANRLHVHERTIYRYCAQGIYKIDIVDQIAREFGVEPKEIFTFVGEDFLFFSVWSSGVRYVPP